MNVTRPRSPASFLIVLLNVVRLALAIVLVVTVAIIGLALFADIRGLELTVVPPSFGVSPESHNNWTVTIPVSLAVDSGRIAAPSIGIERAELQDLRGSLRFPLQRGSFFIFNSFLLILGIGAGLWLTTQLQRVLRTVRDGKPFARSNATRVRTIAWVVIAGEFVRATIVYLENSYAATHFTAEGLRFTARPDFSVVAILEGLIILVIAEVLRVGTRLDEDQSLTV
jgi:Protein of unknown function (DUF2975)